MSRIEKKHIRIALVLLACLVSTFIGAGLGYSTRSLYTAPITADLEISRSSYNLSYTVASLICMAISFNFGRIKAALGSYKRICLVGMFALVLGDLIGANNQSILTVYLATTLITLGFNWTSSVPMTGIVSNWFSKNYGLVLGIVLSGTSLGGSIFSPIVSNWIEGSGWRSAYLYSAVIIGVGLLFILFAMKESPDGSTKAVKEKKKYKFDTALLRDRNFYLLGFAMALMPFSLQAIALNAPTIINDAGHSVEQAGIIASVMYAVCAVSKVVSGWLNDRIGLPITRTILIICGCLGCLSLIFAESIPMQYSYAIFYGIGQSLALTFMPLHIHYVYPDREPAEIMGPMTAFSLVGLMSTPAISFMYELTGTYTSALIIVTASLAIVGILASLAKPTSAKRYR